MRPSERPAPATGTGPSEDVAAKPLFDVHPTVTANNSAGLQLRRRRQAALRCEPLADGRRDPWPTEELPTRLTLHVEVGARTAWLYGRDGRDIFQLLDEVGLERRMWDWSRKAWMVPIQHADEVMAHAEWKQRRLVTCDAVDR